MKALVFSGLFVLGVIEVAYSQEAILFEVITCSQGVAIDGRVVVPGTNISSGSLKIGIPAKGYAGVITADGYTYELKRSMNVKKVNRFVDKKINRGRLTMTGAVHRGWGDVEVMGAPENQYSDFLGDSLFISWIDHGGSAGPYSVTVRNMFDEPLHADTTERSWYVFSFNKVAREEMAILYEVTEVKERQLQHLVKRMAAGKDTKLRFDLSRIPAERKNDLYFQCAVHDLNHFRYDQLFIIYKILSGKKDTPDPLLKKYFLSLSDKYQLQALQFD